MNAVCLLACLSDWLSIHSSVHVQLSLTWEWDEPLIFEIISWDVTTTRSTWAQLCMYKQLLNTQGVHWDVTKGLLIHSQNTTVHTFQLNELYLVHMCTLQCIQSPPTIKLSLWPGADPEGVDWVASHPPWKCSVRNTNSFFHFSGSAPSFPPEFDFLHSSNFLDPLSELPSMMLSDQSRKREENSRGRSCRMRRQVVVVNDVESEKVLTNLHPWPLSKQ